MQEGYLHTACIHMHVTCILWYTYSATTVKPSSQSLCIWSSRSLCTWLKPDKMSDRVTNGMYSQLGLRYIELDRLITINFLNNYNSQKHGQLVCVLLLLPPRRVDEVSMSSKGWIPGHMDNPTGYAAISRFIHFLWPRGTLGWPGLFSFSPLQQKQVTLYLDH